jgi:hypothetical protein
MSLSRPALPPPEGGPHAARDAPWSGLPPAASLDRWLLPLPPQVLPLFVMDVVLPGKKLALNIFEPRYRLMTRRVMEGNRKFGMVSSPRGHEAHTGTGTCAGGWRRERLLSGAAWRHCLTEGRSVCVQLGYDARTRSVADMGCQVEITE